MSNYIEMSESIYFDIERLKVIFAARVGKPYTSHQCP